MDNEIINKNDAADESGRNWLPVCLVSFGALFAAFTAVFAIMYSNLGKTFVLVMHNPFLGGAGWIAIICSALAFGIALAAYLLPDIKIFSFAGGIAIGALSIAIMVMGAFMWWGFIMIIGGLLCLAGSAQLMFDFRKILKGKARPGAGASR